MFQEYSALAARNPQEAVGFIMRALKPLDVGVAIDQNYNTPDMVVFGLRWHNQAGILCGTTYKVSLGDDSSPTNLIAFGCNDRTEFDVVCKHFIILGCDSVGAAEDSNGVFVIFQDPKTRVKIHLAYRKVRFEPKH